MEALFEDNLSLEPKNLKAGIVNTGNSIKKGTVGKIKKVNVKGFSSTIFFCTN